VSEFNQHSVTIDDRAGAGSSSRLVRSLAEGRAGIYDPLAMNLKPKAFALGCCLVLAGCSSGLEGVDKRLAAMQDEITKMQNQNDRLVERLDAIEVRQAKAESAPKPAGLASGTSERPSLKVVKVVPEDDSGMPSPQVGTQAPGEAADDPSPRPVIKLRGSGKSSEKGEGKGEG
jgi:uncharacterized coiled-coil protein SlyX